MLDEINLIDLRSSVDNATNTNAPTQKQKGSLAADQEAREECKSDEQFANIRQSVEVFDIQDVSKPIIQ